MSAQPVWSDPTTGTPVLTFGNGTAVANEAVRVPAVTLPGATASTSWFVAQWTKLHYLDASSLVAPVDDPLFGPALYSMVASDGTSSFSAFQQPGNPGHFVYRMTEGGGQFGALGGSNTILQTVDMPPTPVRMNQPMIVSLDARISQAQGGTGAIQVTLGPILGFNYPNLPGYDPTIPYHTAFIQMPLTLSDPTAGHGTLNVLMPDGSVCVGGWLAGEPLLPFQASAGGLVHLTFDIGRYVQAMIDENAGSSPGWGNEVRDLAKWTADSFCVSLEQSGAGAVGIDVANISITTNPAEAAGQTGAGAAPIVTTVGQDGQLAGTVYATAAAAQIVEAPSGGNFVVSAVNNDLTLAGGRFTVTADGANTIRAASAAVAILQATDPSAAATLAGGLFYTTPTTAPHLTASGTQTAVLSDDGIALDLLAGAAVSVLGHAANPQADTVSAAGAATIYAASLAVLVMQGGTTDLKLASASGGRVTVYAEAGSDLTLAYTGAEGAALTGPGHIRLAGGNFIAPDGIEPSLAVTGTATRLYNLAGAQGTALSLDAGAAVSVFGYGGATTDTISAAGNGSVWASGTTARVAFTGSGAMSLGSSYGGRVGADAQAGTDVSITYGGAEGASVSLHGGAATLAGDAFFVATGGAETIAAAAARIVYLTAGAGSHTSLAGGYYAIGTAAPDARIDPGANDTLALAPGIDPAALLGLTRPALQANPLPGGVNAVTTTLASGRYLISGDDTASALNVISPGSAALEIYFGTPYRTNAAGASDESLNGDLFGNFNVLPGTGSVTLFGAGSAYGFAVGGVFSGGKAGHNLLVGAVSLIGGGAGDTLQGGTHTALLQASNGNTTLIGGLENSLGLAPDGERMVGGAGANTFILGAGNASITGGTGAGDTIIDTNRPGRGATIEIAGFRPGTDIVDLRPGASGTAATADLSHQVADAGGTRVTLSDGITLYFRGLAQVGAPDFDTSHGGRLT